MQIIKYDIKYIKEVLNIWNETIKEGIYFPQIEILSNEEEANKYFSSQDYTGIAVDNDKVFGVYILHPNNIGRCGHISNASYSVSKDSRGKGIGEALVRDSMKQGKKLGYKILQFNAVVISNINAHKLYEKIGFNKIGVVEKGYMNKNNEYEDIVLYYIDL
ncbi:GNAT family N-acetyltransferase [Brachyspira hampsonii]|uniref:GNAT family N-acetyltransferase n=1 Tax=Brachyspira hampsonii TaxID=1287055 RepID=A0AAC9XJW6_9SPIR|nr:GNAT family N-acetyltransferase [Brachyspira hampsonii]ASJ20638.1 GNAT family N-acetyltransferase [Brachyspira hampsonii]MBW5380428.1 GNAT family N-acetyltransferase [Brachyspira hampsonii]MBW5409616.1 GNAT family N-acetyltransferase [Brachyspira hampsonii]OEJ18418.1 GCN5 family acetyltransferase [Brachyspira hampsonii]